MYHADRMALRNMDKDRIDSAAGWVKRTTKIATGNALGESKLVTDGKRDKVEGKIQKPAVGGLKNALKK